MTSTMWPIAILIAALTLASAAEADPLRYLGKEPQATTGWIELGQGHYFEVGAGTEIPAWGRVRDVQEDRLILESGRTEEDKLRARQRGAVVYDTLEIHVPRDDLRLPRVERRPGAGR
jgi:hypothetical protein